MAADKKYIDLNITGFLEVDENLIVATNLIYADSSSGLVGIGIVPTAKLHVVTDNFLFNGTADVIKFSNNLGDWLTVKDGGGIELNNYANGLGAKLGTQDINAYFLNYVFASPKDSTGQSGKEYVTFDANLSNSSPFMKMGINTTNVSASTLVQMNLDKFGAEQAAEPIVLEFLDNYTTHDVDLAGSTKYKTGLKSIMSNSFTTTTTGSGVVRGIWLDVTGGDVNQALYADSGDLIVLNGNVGIGTASPETSLEVEGGMLRLMSNIPGNPTTGKGLEMFYLSNLDTGRIFSRDRDTMAWKNLHLGSSVTGDEVMILGASGNLGVGTVSPSVKLDVNGSIATRSANAVDITVAPLTVTLPDNSFVRLQATSGVASIEGLTGGVDGRRVVLVNYGTNALTMNHEDPAATAGDRCNNGNGAANKVLNQDDTIEYIYDAVSSRWRYIGGSV